MTIFRHWVHNLWIDNCDELAAYNQKRLNEREYFQRYKYWLKREFRHQQKQIREQAIKEISK